MIKDTKEMIDKIIEKLKSHDLVFFVGSAISFRSPSNFPSVEKIREEVMSALCGKEFIQLCSGEVLHEKLRSIQHEEFLERIYSTIAAEGVWTGILDCLRDGTPNANHFLLAQGLGRYYGILLTTNQDCLIESAAKTIGKQFLHANRYGDKFFKDGIIIKLHGDIEKPKTMVTLLRQLTKGLPKSRKNKLKDILRDKCICFVGYSGRDDDIFRILVTSQPKEIFWMIEPKSSLTANVCKLCKRFSGSLSIFECDLDEFFNTLASKLQIEECNLPPCVHPSLKQRYDEWVRNLGPERFNVLGRILSDSRLARYEEALKCFATTKAMIKSMSGKEDVLARTYHYIGNTYMNYKVAPNNYRRACSNYRKGSEYYSAIGDTDGEAETLIGMGESYRHRANYKKALNLYKTAQQLVASRKGKPWIIAKAMRCSADVYRMQDEYDTAIQNYRDAHALFTRHGFLEGANICHIWLAEVYLYKGNYLKASLYSRRAIEIAERYNFEQNLVWANYVKAEINKYRGNRIESLIKDVEEIDKAFQKLGNRLGEAWCNQMLAELFRIQKDDQNFEQKNNKTISLCRRDGVDYRVCLLYAELNQAEFWRNKGKYEDALTKFRQILKIRVGKLKRHRAHASLGVAETLRVMGRGNDKEYQNALRLYKSIRMRHGIVHTLIGFALFKGLKGEDPMPILSEAEAICSQKPKLDKELKIIRFIKEGLPSDKVTILNWPHPLEFL